MEQGNDISYLLHELKSSNQSGDELKMIACLFELKSRLTKSLTPSMADCCFKHDILSLLIALLNKEYRPQEWPHEVVTYTLGMEIVWLLSQLHRPHLEPLLCSPDLVSVLTRFLKTSERFYQFRPAFEEQFRKLCPSIMSFPRQKVTTVPMSKEVWKDMLYYTEHRADLVWNDTVSHLHQCSLTCKAEGQSERVSISAQLINENLAWPAHQKTSTSSSRLFKSTRELIYPSEDNSTLSNDNDNTNSGGVGVSIREDVYIVDFIGGHYFWAYIGNQTLAVIHTIENNLKNAFPNMLRCRPIVRDLVAVLAEKDGMGKPVSVIRGKVLRVIKNEVTVLAVDYGSVKKVEMDDIYQLSESVQHLREVEPQAKVCCLAGVQAPPAELKTVDFALAALVNLTTHHCHNTGAKFKSLRGIDHLLTLLKCGSRCIRLQAIRLAVNISSFTNLSATVDWSPFMRSLLELLMQLTRTVVQQGELDSLLKNTLVVALFCLSNILRRNPTSRHLFFTLAGHLIVLNILRMLRDCSPVVQAVVRTLKAAYPGLAQDDTDSTCGKERGKLRQGEESSYRTPPISTSSLVQRSRRSPTDDSIKLPGEYLQQERGSHNGSRRRREMRRPHEKTRKKEEESSPQQQPATDSTNREVFSDDEVTHVMQHLMITEREAATQLTPGNSSNNNESDTAGVRQLVPVNGTTIPRPTALLYEINEIVSFKDDVTHFLYHADSINSVVPQTVLEVICGMLNSEGGTIFIGITKLGIIRGIPLTSRNKDEVRLKIDRMMSKTEPCIHFNLLHVEFCPVMHKGDTGEWKQVVSNCTLNKQRVDKCCFVIEIKVRAPDELQCFRIGSNTFRRIKDMNHLLTKKDTQEIVTRQMESQYLPEVEALRLQLQRLKNELP